MALRPVRLTMPAFERKPLYRVVEYLRDDSGRVREEGRIWHNDLSRVRKFGRAVACNTTGARVVIADNAGRVVEELPLPSFDDPVLGRWQGWQQQSLPPVPRDRTPLKRPRPVAVAATWTRSPDASPGLPAPEIGLPALPAPQPSRLAPPRDLPTLTPTDEVAGVAGDSLTGNPAPAAG